MRKSLQDVFEGFMDVYERKEERFPMMRIIDTFLLFAAVPRRPKSRCYRRTRAILYFNIFYRDVCFAGDGISAADVLRRVRLLPFQRLPRGLSL